MEMQLALAAVPLSVARPLMKNWNKNGLGVQVIQRFLPKNKKRKKNAYRLYMPIKPVKTKITVPEKITMALTSKGYTVDDYVLGIAVDSTGKRQMRIGKLLKDAELLKEFMNDPQRAAHKDDFTCVVSCHPYDVLAMSTGRRWDQTSCMRLDQPGKSRGGINQHIVKNDIAEGTLVAYAISPKDTNINKPHARLLIKPFVGPNGHILFRIGSKVYGTPIPGFEETLSRWLRKVNAGAVSGMYHLIDGLYNDGQGTDHIVGKFDEIEDKVNLLRSLKLNEPRLRQFLMEDKRWLGVFMENALNIYNGDEGEAAYQISTLYGENRKQITARQFGSYIDKHLEDGVLLDLVEVLAPLAWRDELVKKSNKLQSVVREMYDWSLHDDTEGDNYQFCINKAAPFDSRWLSVINDEIPARDVGLVWRGFLSGMYKFTPELAKSKFVGSVQLRQQVGMLCKMLNQSKTIHNHNVQQNSLKLAKKMPVDFYYDESIYNFLQDAGYTVLFNRYCAEDGRALLCAVDKSWPAADMSIVVDANRMILTDKHVFENMMKVNTQDFNTVLGLRLRQDAQTNGLGPSMYLRDFPWTKSLMVKIAKQNPGPYPSLLENWAKHYLESAEQHEKDLDALMDELGDLDDLEFQPAPENDGFH